MHNYSKALLLQFIYWLGFQRILQNWFNKLFCLKRKQIIKYNLADTTIHFAMGEISHLNESFHWIWALAS